MAERLVKRIPEGSLIAITLSSTTVSTAGMTVYGYAVGRDGTANLLGSVSGENSGTNIVLSADFSALTPGKRYELQIIADPTATNPVTLVPNITYSEVLLEIIDAAAVT